MSSQITTSLTLIESDEYADRIGRVTDIILEDLSVKGYFDEQHGTRIPQET